MRSFSDLPEDITVNIACRLPAKDVDRCRCVSKSWRALLSQPDFIKTHLNLCRNLRQESLLFISKHSKVRNSLSYASLSNAHHLFDEITISAKRLTFAGLSQSWNLIHGSCDGLLLFGNRDHQIFLLNPITKEIRKVPHPLFALDPLRRFIMYGFGYDSLSDDYKIVSISCDRHEYEYGSDCPEMFVDVYSLKTDTWRKVESSPYIHAACQSTSGVFVEGCIHWLVSRKSDGAATIVAFDLAQEKFHEVPPPCSTVSVKIISRYFAVLGFSSLAVLDGRLCAFNPREMDVWVMEKYGVEESWTKFRIDDPEITKIKPLCMLGQENIIVKGIGELFVYNLEERTLVDIHIRGIRPNLLDEASFVESLVSPYGTNEIGENEDVMTGKCINCNYSLGFSFLRQWNSCGSHVY